MQLLLLWVSQDAALLIYMCRFHFGTNVCAAIFSHGAEYASDKKSKNTFHSQKDCPNSSTGQKLFKQHTASNTGVVLWGGTTWEGTNPTQLQQRCMHQPNPPTWMVTATTIITRYPLTDNGVPKTAWFCETVASIEPEASRSTVLFCIFWPTNAHIRVVFGNEGTPKTQDQQQNLESPEFIPETHFGLTCLVATVIRRQCLLLTVPFQAHYTARSQFCGLSVSFRNQEKHFNCPGQSRAEADHTTREITWSRGSDQISHWLAF